MDAKTKAEIERKARLGIPLTNEGNLENLRYYQEIQTALAAQIKSDTSNQNTGGGVGIPSSPTFPGNTVIPDLTSDAVKGYGFTAIVGLGVALLFVSLLSAFRRVRGR